VKPSLNTSAAFAEKFCFQLLVLGVINGPGIEQALGFFDADKNSA